MGCRQIGQTCKRSEQEAQQTKWQQSKVTERGAPRQTIHSLGLMAIKYLLLSSMKAISSMSKSATLRSYAELDTSGRSLLRRMVEKPPQEPRSQTRYFESKGNTNISTARRDIMGSSGRQMS